MAPDITNPFLIGRSDLTRENADALRQARIDEETQKRRAQTKVIDLKANQVSVENKTQSKQRVDNRKSSIAATNTSNASRTALQSKTTSLESKKVNIEKKEQKRTDGNLFIEERTPFVYEAPSIDSKIRLKNSPLERGSLIDFEA